MNNKIIEFNQGKATLQVSNYQYGNRLYVGAIMIEDNEPFGDITVNLPDLPISDNAEGFIDDLINSNTFDLIPKLKKLGIIKESYGKVRYNYGSYEYVKFDLEKLKEYDKVGVERYLSLSNEIEHNINI